MTILERRASDRRSPRLSGRSPRTHRRLRNRPARWQLEEQVRRAAEIQRSLLPDLSAPCGEYRLASLCRPCEALGGDFHDLFRDGNRATLLVADVMGHGIEAALPTMLLRAVFREAATACEQPLTILDEMNGRLRGTIANGAFIAAAVVTLHSRSRPLKLANAGLPHPFLLHSNPRGVEEISLDGQPLGLFDHREPSPRGATELTLAPGDVLLLTSDGIGSIESDDRESFEDHRVRQVLAGAAGRDGGDVISALIHEAIEFSEARPWPDDINLVAITRRGSGPTRGKARPYGPPVSDQGRRTEDDRNLDQQE